MIQYYTNTGYIPYNLSIADLRISTFSHSSGKSHPYVGPQWMRDSLSYHWSKIFISQIKRIKLKFYITFAGNAQHCIKMLILYLSLFVLVIPSTIVSHATNSPGPFLLFDGDESSEFDLLVLVPMIDGSARILLRSRN